MQKICRHHKNAQNPAWEKSWCHPRTGSSNRLNYKNTLYRTNPHTEKYNKQSQKNRTQQSKKHHVITKLTSSTKLWSNQYETKTQIKHNTSDVKEQVNYEKKLHDLLYQILKHLLGNNSTGSSGSPGADS